MNQHHFCDALADNIDEYIEKTSEEYRKILIRLRETIKTAAPDAIEKMAWKMPTFWQGENLLHFAAYKNHLGISPGIDAVNAFAERLINAGYKFNKGSIHIPWNKEIQYDLIAEITKYCVQNINKNK
jgi:uncharacterized protein YdhG (YjbR/CyaY superfamily)